VEYTLTAPIRYVNGRHLIAYPRSVGARMPPPVIRIHPEDPAAVIIVDGVLAAREQPVVLLGSKEEDWLGQRRESGASYVSSRLEVEVADPPDAVDVAVDLAVDLRHTYVGDLKVERLSPWKR